MKLSSSFSLPSKVKTLNSEISDLQTEFENDRSDYLDTIRKQDQQLILLQQILDKVQPTLRKECNYRYILIEGRYLCMMYACCFFCSNFEKIKNDAIWNDEQQRWKIPDLITERTKLPPAGRKLHKCHHLSLSPGKLRARLSNKFS